MRKSKAIKLLGGHAETAAAIGVTYQAVKKWPDVLSQRVADRVVAAIARKHLSPTILGESKRKAQA